MRLFVDSGPFIGLVNPRDPWHREATRTMESIRAGRLPYRRLYASNYVLGEVVTHVLHETRSHESAVRALEMLEGSGYLALLHVTPEVHTKALDIFRRTPHPLLSITDCTSAALMEAHSIDTIFTFDRDFGKLGLKVVP